MKSISASRQLNSTMTVSITELQERLHDILREVETKGTIVDIVRDGYVVAHIVPVTQPDRLQPGPRLPLSDEGLGDPAIAERVDEILGYR